MWIGGSLPEYVDNYDEVLRYKNVLVYVMQNDHGRRIFPFFVACYRPVSLPLDLNYQVAGTWYHQSVPEVYQVRHVHAIRYEYLVPWYSELCLCIPTMRY